MRPARGATFTASGSFSAGIFQSTRPVRGATGAALEDRDAGEISIHAPRAGRDLPDCRKLPCGRYFNPRAPCGARPHVPQFHRGGILYFNPRAPCGARRPAALPLTLPWDFNPRAPCGARRMTERPSGLTSSISIHAPRAGRDPQRHRFPGHRREHFNPRAPCGARLVAL